MIKNIVLLTLFIVNFTIASACSIAQPKALLLIGMGNKVDVNHPYYAWDHPFFNQKIKNILQGVVDITISQSSNDLTIENLKNYDLIINNSLMYDAEPQQREALYQYVETGGSYLSLHAGILSFIDDDRYTTMMGGTFIGHDDFKTFTVNAFDNWYGIDHSGQMPHPVVRGVSSFSTSDELYLVQMNSPDVDVIARSEYHPIVWSRHWHKGKLIALTLGHGEESVNNQGYQLLLKNSVHWLLEQPIIEPIRASEFPVNAKPVKHYLNLEALTHHADLKNMTYRINANSSADLLTANISDSHYVDLAFMKNEVGTASIEIEAMDSLGRSSKTAFEVTIREPTEGNLARLYGVKVHTSSNEIKAFTADPNHVIDGDSDSRWSSDYLDDSWIYLDLGQEYNINKVKLVWEGAHAKAYDLQVARNLNRWQTVHTKDNSQGGTETITFAPQKARYVKMRGEERALEWGYSLYEFEVYGANR